MRKTTDPALDRSIARRITADALEAERRLRMLPRGVLDRTIARRMKLERAAAEVRLRIGAKPHA